MCSTTPLLHWWNKYTAYHGQAHTTTPSHTVAKLSGNGMAVSAGGVEFQFHRTLRVPDTADANKLPPVRCSPNNLLYTAHLSRQSLGHFQLSPVAKYEDAVTDEIAATGGFIMVSLSLRQEKVF